MSTDQPSWLAFADAMLARAALLARARAEHAGSTDPLARVVDDLTRADDEGAPSEPVGRLADELVGIGEDAFARAADAAEPIGAIAATAALTSAEAAVLALFAAVELDPRRQELAGRLTGDAVQPWLTPYAVQRVLEDADVATALGPGSGLSRACLLEVAGDRPWGSAAIRPARAVTWWLAGDESLDPALPAGLEQLVVAGEGSCRLGLAAGSDRIRRLQALTAQLTGAGFLIVPAAVTEAELDALVRRASLSGEAVVVEVDGELPAAVRARIERAFHVPWGIASSHELPIRTLPRRAWTELTVPPAAATAEELAAAFGPDYRPGAALTAEQLDAAATAHAGVGGSPSDAVRRSAAGQIERLANRIVPSRGWDDLVLDPHRMDLVRSVVDRARHGDVVYDEWSFSPLPSRGVTALFSGPSGTGKTLTAEIVAGALGLDLYRLDLSQMVSKYVGETEKNLSEVFAAAEASPVVLFFDEADALLGKRSEVSDAHDRYANVEVAYLLQRLERHNGVVVLATNLANNIDQAFLRRVHVAVEFRMPEPAERLRIWRHAIPASAPVDGVDLAFFADRFELSGGSIRNAATAAAFLAATAGTPITMPVLAVAVKREMQKLARMVRPEDFGEWSAAVAVPGAEAMPAPRAFGNGAPAR